MDLILGFNSRWAESAGQYIIKNMDSRKTFSVEKKKEQEDVVRKVWLESRVNRNIGEG